MVNRNPWHSGAYRSMPRDRALAGKLLSGMDNSGHLPRSRCTGSGSRVNILVHSVQGSDLRCSTCRTGRCAAGPSVLEVGCGPVFFTIPAAAIVGEEGCSYGVWCIERWDNRKNSNEECG